MKSKELYVFGDGETATYSKSEADSVMDAMEARIKELEAQLENVQNTMYTDNVDLGMENHKLKERIKEMEAENKALHQANLDCYAHFDTLKEDYDKLKEQVPMWINVKDRLPSNQEMVIGLVVGTDLVTKDWTPELNERIKRTEMCYYVDGDGWYSSEGYQMVVSPRMWIPLPPPPTDESSATEKENG